MWGMIISAVIGAATAIGTTMAQKKVAEAQEASAQRRADEEAKSQKEMSAERKLLDNLESKVELEQEADEADIALNSTDEDALAVGRARSGKGRKLRATPTAGLRVG